MRVPRRAGCVLILVLVAAWSGPLLAENSEEYRTELARTTDPGEPHPKQTLLALAPTDDFRLASCEIRYFHHRDRRGGKMIVTLEVLKESETVTIGRKRLKLKLVDGVRRATFAWADPSGWTGDGPSATSDSLPLALAPGDVVLWTLKFKGVPKNPAGEESFFVTTRCHNCRTGAGECVWEERP